ncbi:MAG TPA: DUF4910 domain-containing protein [Planctomycetota bacterium]|nr:DUF4910 domain-containing protein [Planctomycetota bacterium]
MHLDELTRLIDAEVSTSELVASIEAIQGMDRHFTYPKFMESARWVEHRLSGSGLDSRVLEQPADGTTRMGDWTMPMAWDCREAVLELLKPDGSVSRVLCKRSQDPNCTVMWSAPTPPEGVKAAVIGPLEFNNGKANGATGPEFMLAERGGRRPIKGGELAGKIVFTTLNPRNVKTFLAEQKAAGVISSFMPRNQPLPENRFWVNGWADDSGGWAFTAQDTPMWGFMLTPRQGEELASLLAAGPVQARASVDSRIYEGVLPAATGLLRGQSREEILILGHQFEIGADDSASGCAVMLEAARILSGLVSRGLLPQPRRSIRFLFMSECYGSMAYAVMNPQLAGRTLAGMNLDCVGGDQRKVDMGLPVSLTPPSNPSVADTLILRLCRGYLRWRDPFFAWTTAAFTPCDSTISDPLIGIPVVYLGGKDRFWHTTADTIDKIDPEATARVAVLAASYAYYLAAAGSEEAEWLAEETAADGRAELARLGGALAGDLRRAAPAERGRVLGAAVEALEHCQDVAAERVRSAQKFAAHAERREFRAALRPMISQIKKQTRLEQGHLVRLAERLASETEEGRPLPQAPARPAWWEEAGRVIPTRLVPGTITLDSVPMAKREGFYSPRWSTWLANVLFRCDGRRTLAEACRLGTLDSGKPDVGSSFEPVRFFRFLERHGLVELRPAKPAKPS